MTADLAKEVESLRSAYIASERNMLLELQRVAMALEKLEYPIVIDRPVHVDAERLMADPSADIEPQRMMMEIRSLRDELKVRVAEAAQLREQLQNEADAKIDAENTLATCRLQTQGLTHENASLKRKLSSYITLFEEAQNPTRTCRNCGLPIKYSGRDAAYFHTMGRGSYHCDDPAIQGRSATPLELPSTSQELQVQLDAALDEIKMLRSALEAEGIEVVD